MNIVKEVPFRDVMDCYIQENAESESFESGKGYLNQCAQKRWYLVHLCDTDILNAMLPGHDHGSVPLVLRGSWLSLSETVKRFERFKEQMPECQKNVSSHEDRDFSKTHIFLEKPDEGLQHLDGFHRLLAYVFFHK